MKDREIPLWFQGKAQFCVFGVPFWPLVVVDILDISLTWKVPPLLAVLETFLIFIVYLETPQPSFTTVLLKAIVSRDGNPLQDPVWTQKSGAFRPSTCHPAVLSFCCLQTNIKLCSCLARGVTLIHAGNTLFLTHHCLKKGTFLEYKYKEALFQG